MVNGREVAKTEDKIEDIKRKLYMLTPLQREILDIFLKKKVSWTTHEIWTALINEFFNRIMQAYSKVMSVRENPYYKFTRDMDRDMDKLLEELDFFPVELTISRYLPPKNITLKEIYFAQKEFQEKYKKAKSEKDILYCKLKFVRHFYRFPTVKKVEEVLNSLVCMGILSTFTSTDKRVKNVYYIDPEFAEVYDEIKHKESKIKREKEDISA